jgi:hypothetical protein
MTWTNPRPLLCSCEPADHEECGCCARARRKSAYNKLTNEQRDYDRYVDPRQQYSTDFPAGCSCHINPPCGYCTGETTHGAAHER